MGLAGGGGLVDEIDRVGGVAGGGDGFPGVFASSSIIDIAAGAPSAPGQWSDELEPVGG